jgi:alkylation response protein AidB-like acyl-CoA dehydrogenase
MSADDRFNLWAGTVAAHGSAMLQEQFLPRLRANQIGMCLLYSEPEAGSDLANVRTRAERDGDGYVVNGQKVWTSGARSAEYAFLLARTDWSAPKHQGISFFFFPMRQPGVEIRPLRQATGDARFNEVFLTDARVPAANMLGAPGEGWRVLQTALGYERVVMGVIAGGGESGTAQSSGEWQVPTPDLSLVALAQALGVAGDPVLRQGIARLHCMRTVNGWNTRRAGAALSADRASSVASLGKLAMSGILHYAASLEAQIRGAAATVVGPGDEWKGSADGAYSLLNAYFTSIGGGTDQIQRNIIAERVLGLPKERHSTELTPS